MDKKCNEILEVVALHYPMGKDKILKLQAGPGEASTARYAAYKLMISAGCTPNRVAQFFGAKLHNVKASISKYETWLRIYKDMQADYCRLEKEVLK
jgi:hypothetical protein